MSSVSNEWLGTWITGTPLLSCFRKGRARETAACCPTRRRECESSPRSVSYRFFQWSSMAHTWCPTWLASRAAWLAPAARSPSGQPYRQRYGTAEWKTSLKAFATGRPKQFERVERERALHRHPTRQRSHHGVMFLWGFILRLQAIAIMSENPPAA